MQIALKMTGCKNNRYELDQVLNWAVKRGVGVVEEKEADYCIINTCTVTHVADKKSRQMVRRTKNGNPHLKTIVFGCAARMQKEAFEKIMEVDYLLSDLRSVIAFLEQAWLQNSQSKRLTLEKVNFLPTRARALVQIQDGCDNFCSFCIIAEARGRSESKSIEEVVAEVNKQHKKGFNEVVITGINIGAYGAPKSTDYEQNKMAELLEAILKKTDMPRIRLSSMGPQYFNERIYELLKNPRFCRHMHLSIQSGSDGVLKRMRRQHDRAGTLAVVKRLQNDIPGMAITTDIIVGFPEETEAEFEETMEFVREGKLAKVHAFPYSERKNTSAIKLEQVPVEVRKARRKLLQDLADDYRKAFIDSQLGTEASVLWEKMTEPGVFEGITDNYIRVRKKGPNLVRSISREVLSEDNVIF